MRVAVLFFGEIRSNQEVWKNIYEKVVKPNNADVFMHHIYYEPEFFKNYTEEQYEFVKMFYLRDKKEVHYTPPKELFEVFKPKKAMFDAKREYPCPELPEIINKIDPQMDELPNTYEQVKLNYFTIRSQSESRKIVLDLKNAYEREHGFEYDAVIMTRLDISITDTIRIDAPMDSVNATILGFGNYSPKKFAPLIREQVITGNSKLMNVIGSFYEEAPALYVELCNMTSNFKQNEFFLAQHLRRNGIVVKDCQFPLTFYEKNMNPNGLIRSEKSFVENS